MSDEIDFSFMGQDDLRHPSFPYFKKAMEGVRYGQSETINAWEWFRDGWNSLQYSLIKPHPTEMNVKTLSLDEMIEEIKSRIRDDYARGGQESVSRIGEKWSTLDSAARLCQARTSILLGQIDWKKPSIPLSQNDREIIWRCDADTDDPQVSEDMKQTAGSVVACARERSPNFELSAESFYANRIWVHLEMPEKHVTWCMSSSDMGLPGLNVLACMDNRKFGPERKQSVCSIHDVDTLLKFTFEENL